MILCILCEEGNFKQTSIKFDIIKPYNVHILALKLKSMNNLILIFLLYLIFNPVSSNIVFEQNYLKTISF
jgi:hypothetical protein